LWECRHCDATAIASDADDQAVRHDVAALQFGLSPAANASICAGLDVCGFAAERTVPASAHVLRKLVGTRFARIFLVHGGFISASVLRRVMYALDAMGITEAVGERPGDRSGWWLVEAVAAELYPEKAPRHQTP
jgi:hypothetical protein